MDERNLRQEEDENVKSLVHLQIIGFSSQQADGKSNNIAVFDI